MTEIKKEKTNKREAYQEEQRDSKNPDYSAPENHWLTKEELSERLNGSFKKIGQKILETENNEHDSLREYAHACIQTLPHPKTIERAINAYREAGKKLTAEKLNIEYTLLTVYAEKRDFREVGKSLLMQIIQLGELHD